MSVNKDSKLVMNVVISPITDTGIHPNKAVHFGWTYYSQSAKEVREGKVFQFCLSVCLSVIMSKRWGSHVTITHDALDLSIERLPPSWPQSPIMFLPLLNISPHCKGTPHLDMFKLFKIFVGHMFFLWATDTPRQVGKSAVRILLECFLVAVKSLPFRR